MTFFSTGGASTGANENIAEQNGTVLPPNISTVLLPPSPSTQNFIVAEISYFQPQISEISYDISTGAMPTGAFSLSISSPSELGQVLISDLGFISNPSDSIGQKLYAPVLLESWRLDRSARLEPWSQSGSVSWGSLSFINHKDRYTAIVEQGSPDGRTVAIKKGVKRFDKSRGVFVDPPYSEMTTIFSGVGNGLWRRNVNTIDLDIRDAGYQGENPIQRVLYGGTGGYDGSDNIKGRPLPFCRGGSASNPIQNVSPVMIDPINNIWQYNDAPGSIINLYERGAEVFTYAGDTTNLYSGSVAAGAYRTDNSRGLFQLGSPAVGAITADVTGDFAVASSQNTAASIARFILTETIGIDPAYIDIGAFIGLDADRNFKAGIYLTEPVDAMSVVDTCLRSINAWLTPTHSGFLQPVVLRAPGFSGISATYGAGQIISCAVQTLPELLTPPPYRIRVAYNQRYTTQTDNWAGAATEDRKQFAAEQWSFANWLSADNLANYRRLNDPPPVETYLLEEANAQSIADEFGAIFGTRRSIYNLELPMYLASRHEIGSSISFSYPGISENPVMGLVLGDSVDFNSASFTLKVLV